MELSKQVTSLELSRRLKELGFEQESLFYHSANVGGMLSKEQFLAHDPFNQEKLQDDGFREAVDKTYSAYTVAELGEMLPERIKINHEEKSFSIFREKINETWDVAYSTNTDDDCGLWQQANTEANARAKMLIYLKENKYV